MRIAVLDDYLKVAQGLANWSSLGADVKFFPEFIQPDQLAKTLADFEVVVAMRERSAFPAAVIQSMPKLKLLVTTGLRNNSLARRPQEHRCHCRTRLGLDAGIV